MITREFFPAGNSRYELYITIFQLLEESVKNNRRFERVDLGEEMRNILMLKEQGCA